MNSKSVLICNVHSLLVGGVKSLLDASDQFVIASLILTDDLALAQEIERSKPDIVIMDDETLSFIEPEQLLEIFRIVPSLKLIVLDRQISRMDVYDKREFMISHPSHLIQALV